MRKNRGCLLLYSMTMTMIEQRVTVEFVVHLNGMHDQSRESKKKEISYVICIDHEELEQCISHPRFLSPIRKWDRNAHVIVPYCTEDIFPVVLYR